MFFNNMEVEESILLPCLYYLVLVDKPQNEGETKTSLLHPTIWKIFKQWDDTQCHLTQKEVNYPVAERIVPGSFSWCLYSYCVLKHLGLNRTCVCHWFLLYTTSATQRINLVITFVSGTPRKHGNIELPWVPIQVHRQFPSWSHQGLRHSL